MSRERQTPPTRVPSRANSVWLGGSDEAPADVSCSSGRLSRSDAPRERPIASEYASAPVTAPQLIGLMRSTRIEPAMGYTNCAASEAGTRVVSVYHHTPAILVHSRT